MTWHYVAVREYDKATKEWYYSVGEKYPRFGIVPECMPSGSSRKELIRDLEMMLEDVKRYRTEVVRCT